ncbi:MAG TPA: HAD family hydrolase [Pontiellaceae bacterium]|nr:HAD family hydrolase [Pontiellaceae bacterium]HPR83240.1 HAD family hydrolase [Pontiellaceae bacterium]
MSLRCVFFDRDGVVNRVPDPERYVTGWDKFHLLPAFVESLRIVQQRGFVAVVVTNQQGVGKGEYSLETVQEMHRNLRRVLAEQGLELLDVYCCPHLAADNCACRKPKPGMFLQAAAKHDIDLQASWMVGDQEHDMTAGHAAGCRCIRVGGEKTAAEHQVASMNDLPALLDKIL